MGRSITADTMKILIVLPRGTMRKTFGGAEIQALKTEKFLSQMGASVRIIEAVTEAKAFSDCDIVHIFDHTDTLFSSRLARKIQKKLVFSPIYWPEKGRWNIVQKIRTYLAMENPQFFFNQLRKPYSMTFYLAWRSFPSSTGYLRDIMRQIWAYPFVAADTIIVNSDAEKKIVANIVASEVETRTRVVYNGVDDEVYGRPVTEKLFSLFAAKHRITNYVLSVGRIEPRKNQTMLIKACKQLGLPFVCVGRTYDRYYAQRVFKELEAARIQYKYIPYLRHESDMLISAYLNAKIVALPSTMETPGLVALEAASLGRTIVVTDVGSAREYFRDNAYYVNPEQQDDITEKIHTAWNRPLDEKKLRKFVLQNYTWRKAAEDIINIYRKLGTATKEN